MPALLDAIVPLARLTLEDPRKGARAVLGLGVPMPARTAGLLLMAVASALMTHLGFLILPATDDPLSQFISASPLRTAVMQWITLALAAILIHRIGRARGGIGSFPDTVLLIVWLQLLMLVLQVAQLLLLVLLPPLAAPLSLAGIVLFFWLLTSFIAELHGFRSRGAVLTVVVLTILAVAFLISLSLAVVLGPEALTHV